jgi:hypothetical protein
MDDPDFVCLAETFGRFRRQPQQTPQVHPAR